MRPFPCARSAWKMYGNYKRICWGTIYVHPVRPWWWALEIYIIIIMCVFAAEYEKFVIWQTVLGLGMGAFCLVTSFKTILCDPGIWPRPSYEEAVENYENIQRNPTRYRRKMVEGSDGKTVEFSYCYRCNTYRPPSAGHCGICDCCIKDWDHHCPVFGGCVGYKNKCWFFCMTFSIPVFWVFMLGLSGITVITDSRADSNWYGNLTLCLSIAAFLGVLIVPPILSCCCRCVDTAHTGESTRNINGPRWFQDDSSTTNATYPRQPPVTKAHDEKNDEIKRLSNEGRSNNNTTDVEINFLTY